MHHVGWRDAMQKKISTLEDNETWVMMKLPHGEHTLG